MSVTVTYHCGGCSASASAQVRQHFQSLFGDKGYGFGCYVVDDIKDVAPEGWVAFDAIGATYCPDCWAEISNTSAESQR